MDIDTGLAVEFLHDFAMIFEASFEAPFFWRYLRKHNNLSEITFSCSLDAESCCVLELANISEMVA